MFLPCGIRSPLYDEFVLLLILMIILMWATNICLLGIAVVSPGFILCGLCDYVVKIPKSCEFWFRKFPAISLRVLQPLGFLNWEPCIFRWLYD